LLLKESTPTVEAPPVSATADERDQVRAVRNRLDRAARRLAADNDPQHHAAFVELVGRYGAVRRLRQRAEYDRLTSELEAWPGVARDFAAQIEREA
jgi:hypothetical protein